MARASRVPDRLAPLALPALNGKQVVITGASAGIGQACALALAGAGATVILGVRNLAKGQTTAELIRAATPGADVRVEEIELGSLASISAFATRVGSTPIDLLINNAGLSSNDPAATTTDGFELLVGVNYLGAYALVCGLWPALTAAAGRVVMLGSLMATRGEITAEFGGPTGSTTRSYSDSKLAAVLFATELHRRCQRAGSPVTAVAAHPGWAQTDIFTTNGPPEVVNWLGKLFGALQSPTDGAQPVLMAATTADPAPYYGPLSHSGLAGLAGAIPLPRGALVDGAGATVWNISEQLTGITLRP